jgi:hypothetical protein
MNNDLDETRRSRRPRRLEEVSAEVGFPLAWVLIGAVAGLLVIGLLGLGVINILRQQAVTPTPAAMPGLVPTQPLRPTQPAGATPTIPPVVTLAPTPTITPTETLVPTVPAQLTLGLFAQVHDTDMEGLSVREGPGTNNLRVSNGSSGGILKDGTIVEILEGPEKDETGAEYIWWKIRAPDGTQGWTVQNFLRPSLPPGAE